MYTYEIAGKKYFQKKLVLGQIGPLAQLLAGARFMATDPLGLIAALGESLPEALAIVLIPEGVHPADKDMQQIRRDLFDADLETVALKVVDDFLDCNPIHLLLEKVAGMIGKVTSTIG
jgi:hypothetical protein